MYKILFRKSLLLPLLIIILAVSLRLPGLANSGLSYDELQAVTYADRSLLDTATGAFIFDAHPPLYFLFLNIWSHFSKSDYWMRLSSVFLSVCTIISVYFITKRLYGTFTSTTASLFISFSCLSVYWSQSVTKYSMMMFLGLCAWFTTYAFLYGKRPFLYGAAIVFFSVSCTLTHGIGFLLVVSTSCYAAMIWARGEINSRSFYQWVYVQLIVLIVSLPWLFVGYLKAKRGWVAHTITPSLTDIANMAANFFPGMDFHSPLIPWLSLLFISIILGILLIKNPEFRPIIIAFIILPVVFCVVLSYSVSPVWVPKKPMSFFLPFLCMALAYFSSRLPSWFKASETSRAILRNSLTVLMLLPMIAALFYQQQPKCTQSAPDPIKFVHNQAKKNDVIIIPSYRLFWGWAWNLAGPGSIKDLKNSNIVKTPQDTVLVTRDAIKQSICPGKTVWLINFDRSPKDRIWFSDYLPDDLIAQFKLEKTFSGVSVRKAVLKNRGPIQ